MSIPSALLTLLTIALSVALLWYSPVLAGLAAMLPVKALAVMLATPAADVDLTPVVRGMLVGSAATTLAMFYVYATDGLELRLTTSVLMFVGIWALTALSLHHVTM